MPVELVPGVPYTITVITVGRTETLVKTDRLDY